MMKKLLSAVLLGLIVTTSFGQTIVSTSPENKKVILKTTGIHCVYCPEVML